MQSTSNNTMVRIAEVIVRDGGQGRNYRHE